jgi:hypothetical protein
MKEPGNVIRESGIEKARRLETGGRKAGAKA